MSFLGYTRPDGRVGVRNRILVIATVDCVEPVARRIAAGFEGAVAVTQHHSCLRIGCENIVHTLAGVGSNPNVAAVLLVGMGCEAITAESIASGIVDTGKPVEIIILQEEGGTRKTIEEGRRIVEGMVKVAQAMSREEHHVSKLILGLKCGGSDATSGVAANPALGAAADLLIDEGGAAVMIEPLEAVGAEEELAGRAANEAVRHKVLRMVSNEEKRWTVPGMQVEFMCKGNVDGGLSTIEEKALGAVHKGGTKPIQGVLRNDEEVLEKVPGPGFYLQDGTHLEPMALSYLVAAGAQIVVFTSGRGGTFGHAVVPVLKVCGNPETFERLRDDLDINAGTIMEGGESIERVGSRIFREMLEVASGKLTKGEELGYDNFSVYRKDPRLDALLGVSLR